MSKMIKITYKLFFCLVGIYLIIPILIFFLGYLKLIVGVPCALAISVAFFFAARDCNNSPDCIRSEDSFELPVKYLVISVIFAVIVTILSGVGEYVWSTYDHAFRRATLNDMVNYCWPIIYDPATQENPEVIAQITSFEPQGFVYYFTFWMVPAVIGKLFDLNIANVTLVVWTSAGITLILLGMAMYLKRFSYCCLFVFLTFSGIDAVPFVLNQILFDIPGLDGCVPYMSYVSNFGQLQNVFNQAVPCFLIVLLLMLTKNNRNIGTIAALIFAYSPWATVGMIFIAAVQLFRKENRSSDKKRNIKNILNIGNVLVPVIVLFVFGSFYLTKTEVTTIKGFTYTYYSSIWKYVLAYIILIVIEVLPSAGLVFSKQKKNPLFWCVIILLLLFPLYRVTKANDFVMRCSMPCLFILSVFFAQKVSDYTLEDEKLFAKRQKRKGRRAHLKLAVLSLVMVLMSFVSVYYIYIVISAMFYGDLNRAHAIESFGNQYESEFYYEISSQFYVPDYEEKFFFRYLAR